MNSPCRLIIFAFFLSFALKCFGHALIEPAVGVQGAGSRSDVQRPSAAEPCGNVDLASAISSSQKVSINDMYSFSVTVQSFNGGEDGSRQVTAKVDPSGTGKSFTTTANVTNNGELAPASAGSQQVDVSLPQGTVCSGSGGTCLVSFTTAGGFGNCVIVSQGVRSASSSNSTTNSQTQTASNSTSTTTSNGKTKSCSKVENRSKSIAHGTLRARALTTRNLKRSNLDTDDIN